MTTERTRTGRTRVRLHVVVRRPGLLRIFVTGPAPSCGAAGVLRVHARRGGNDVLFGGRIGDRQLEPGLYALTPTFARAARLNRTSVVVRVGPRGGVLPVERGARTFACHYPPGGSASAGKGVTSSVFAPRGGSGRGTGSRGGFGEGGSLAAFRPPHPGLPLHTAGAATPAKSGSGEHGSGGASDTLGAIATRLAPTVGGRGFDWISTLAAIAVVFFGTLSVATLVIRFMRGTWNP